MRASCEFIKIQGIQCQIKAQTIQATRTKLKKYSLKRPIRITSQGYPRLVDDQTQPRLRVEHHTRNESENNPMQEKEHNQLQQYNTTQETTMTTTTTTKYDTAGKRSPRASRQNHVHKPSCNIFESGRCQEEALN